MRALLSLTLLIILALYNQNVAAKGLDTIDAINEQAIQWRRHLHQFPELSNREFNTAKYIASHLDSLGLDVKTNIAHTGVIAILHGQKKGPLIALRADIDALPITELVMLPFASKQTAQYRGQEVGVMHACGHDAHTAILMAVASRLTQMKDQLSGSVMFIFQPAEEGAPKGEEGGAELMLKEGIFDQQKPEAIFGLHVTNRLNTGKIGYRSGPIMASEDSFTIKVQGKQTHGSRPWHGIDPIVTSAQIIMAAQTIASRQINVTKAPSVISFGAINGGIRSNIIPDSVELIGTIRSFDQDMRKDIKERLTNTASFVAQSSGAQAHVDIDHGYPVTINNPALTTKMLPTLQRVAGENNVSEMDLITGAEDFSYYALETAGLFFFLGVTPAGQDPSTSAGNHSPHFYLDEKAIALGIESLTHLAIDYLNKN